MSEPNHVKVDDGLVYISMDAIVNIMDQIVAVREAYLDEEKHSQAIAGSDSTLALLLNVLDKIRTAALESEDLTEEVQETIEGLYDFLDEQ